VASRERNLTVTYTAERKATAVFAGVLAVVCALVATRWQYAPVWDGRIYAECIATAAESWSAESLRCGGHASQAFASLAAQVQMVAPRSAIPLLVTNAVLFLAACLGFFRLVRLVFAESAAIDQALLACAFAAQPAFLAAVVQPGLDLPLLPQFIWAIVFMLERRWLPVILMGLALAFTKETGVLLYALVVSCYALTVELRAGGTGGERITRVVRLAPLALPTILFVAYLLYRSTRPNEQIIWSGSSTNESLVSQFLVPRLDLYQVNYAVLILVLNFAWIMSAVVALDAFVGMVRLAHREPRRAVAVANGERLRFLTILAIVIGYALTRFTTFGHTRYFVVVTALVLVLFYASLVRLEMPMVARRAIIGSYAALLLVSATRTVDPVSRRIYGTFEFGSHRLLHMTRVTGECCGMGLDQLVYNLQFTAFDALVSDAFAALRPGDSSLVVVPDSTSWILIEGLDPRTRRRTLATTNIVRPRVMEPRHLVTLRRRPTVGYYVALPNGDDARARRQLETVYSVGPERRFRRYGYSLSVYPLSLRERTAAQ
jgi:hypothetical protein